MGTLRSTGLTPPEGTISVGGLTYPAITLTVIGPFSVREGVIFIPSTIDLFGPSNPTWAGNASGATVAQQSDLDVRPLSDGQLDLAASSWRYNTNSVNPADAASADSAATALAPSVVSSNPVSSTTVQGEPETALQSTTNQACLTGGSGCPQATLGPGPHSLFGDVILIGAVASIGALVAIGVVARRRQLPPPSYPNAVLYPPGVNGRTLPAGASGEAGDAAAGRG